jgi:hypothetical protein
VTENVEPMMMQIMKSWNAMVLLISVLIGDISGNCVAQKWWHLKKSNDKAEQLIFGFPAEWRDFHERNTLFLQRFPHLKAAFDTAFLRTAHFSEPIDKFLFM